MSEYSIVRCHGLATHLLSSQVIDALASSQNAREFADMFASTDYGTIKDLQEADASSLEEALKEVFEKELIIKYEYVLATSSGVLRKFLIAHYRRLEVQALTRILRSKVANPPQNVTPLLPSITGLTDLPMDRLVEAKDVEEVTEHLKDTPYSSIAKSLHWYHEYGSTLPLEFHLKKIYYEIAFKALQRIHGEDHSRISRLLGMEIDITNCFTAIAPMLYGYSNELSKQLIIPHFFMLEPSKVEGAIEANSSQTLLALLAHYAEILKPALENKDESLSEAKALKLIQNEVRKQMREASIGLTYIICYLTLHEIERRNLTFLANAIKQNVRATDYLVM